PIDRPEPGRGGSASGTGAVRDRVDQGVRDHAAQVAGTARQGNRGPSRAHAERGEAAAQAPSRGPQTCARQAGGTRRMSFYVADTVSVGRPSTGQKPR